MVLSLALLSFMLALASQSRWGTLLFFSSPNRLTPSLKFAYFMGFPYLALIFGLLPPPYLGLHGLEYLNRNELRQSLLTLGLTWLADAWVILPLALLTSIVAVGVRPAFKPSPPLSWLELTYQCCHVAFYRAIFWLTTQDLYLGIVLGTALVLVEWVLTRHEQWVQAVPLLLTSCLFFYSPNLGLLWLVHGLILKIMR